jgi:hypothetical protein
MKIHRAYTTKVVTVALEGTYTDEEWRDLCECFERRCVCCGVRDKPLQADHVVPRSRGGTNYISNIQPLCARCNNRKGTKDTDYRDTPFAGDVKAKPVKATRQMIIAHHALTQSVTARPGIQRGINLTLSRR